VTQAQADRLERWRQFVEDLVEARRGSRDLETQTGYVLLEHGERVVSQLLDALRADERFVRLAGRWFLRELAVPPTGEQLAALAWAMVALEEPLHERDPKGFGKPLGSRVDFSVESDITSLPLKRQAR
jgi:hypothetical protein